MNVEHTKLFESAPFLASVPPLIELLSSSEPAGPLSRPAATTPTVPGARVGRLIGLTSAGQPIVRCDSDSVAEPLVARHTIPVGPGDLNREVVLVFEEENPRRPIIIGILQGHSMPPVPEELDPIQVNVDGEKVILTGKSEIVLRCGKSSITLTRAGKILIRGAYLLSRSSGVNRIKGGSVQIN